MYAQSQNGSSKFTRHSVFRQLLTISILTISVLLASGFSGVAQTLPLPAPEAINWVTGPATSTLGEYADIAVPEGFIFATADQAKTFLKLNNLTIPSDLVGVLLPTSRKWMITFEFADTGHVMDSTADQVDPAAMMMTLHRMTQARNELAARQGVASITLVDWEMQPTYVSKEHSLEYAIRFGSANGGSVVHHYMILLGRSGLLTASAQQSRQLLAEAIPVTRIMSGVTYKAGYGYTDFRKGDKVSAHTISGLITGDDAAEMAAAARSFFSSKKVIAGIVGGALLICGIGTWLIVRTLRKKGVFETLREEIAPMSANSHGNGYSRPAFPTEAAQPIHVNGKNGHSKVRRRRMFNYQKYYADLMMQVSDRAYESGFKPAPRNGESSATYQAVRNGNSDGHVAQPGVTGNLGLIESQRNLIEEQQRLIREQTRLIEEKTRLIHEKNQVLEKQTELFGNNNGF